MTTVLVVDDDPGVRHVIDDVLSDAGFAVTCAANGRVALDEVARAEPDVILLDLDMPVMGGREFYHALRETGRSTPVIILSAGASHAGRLELGADDSVAKPFDIDDLVAHIVVLVSSHGPRGGAAQREEARRQAPPEQRVA